jgi:uncharacterized membrane protein YgdD (TMEM256/DUF423 family)
MHKGFLQTAAILGALAVALGAFGAHGLKKIVPPETITTFETGVRYQFYHVFALLAVAILFGSFPGKNLQYAGICFIIGIILFSGSLYLMTALQAAKTEVPRIIGPITPIGGVFFIVGWIFLFLGVMKK